MILVNDIIGEVSQCLGRCDQPYLFSVIQRAVETLARKACSAPGAVTWDPMTTYLELPVQRGYYIYLPHQIEKPIAININGNPSFAHNNLYRFVQNGPGDSEMEAGWQWRDELTSPIQRRFPRGQYQLNAVSDSEDDIGLTMNVKIRGLQQGDYVIPVPITAAGAATSPTPQFATGVIEVVKPATLGTVTLFAGPYVLAYYYPNITLPEFSCIKLSQKAASVTMFARKKTMQIMSLLDVIPLNSAQAVITQCQTIKYIDETHFDMAAVTEALAVQYLTEEQTARNQYLQQATTSQVTTALNLTIGQRDSLIVADIYDDACTIFGPIGRTKVFDRITSTLEVVYNSCQYWDGLVGVATLHSDDDYYVSLPRYVDTILAMNINRQVGPYRSPWFEFSYAGQGEFGDLRQNDGNWVPWNQLAITEGSTNAIVNPYSTGYCGPNSVNGSNRSARGWEEVGSTPLAFRLKGPAQLYAQPELGQDNGARLTIYGYLDGVPVVNSRGEWGVEIPCYVGRTTPCKSIFDQIERVSKDPTYGFINLFATNPYVGQSCPPRPFPVNPPNCPPVPPPNCNPTVPIGPITNCQTQFVSMFWPWDTEPMYRLIRVGTMCKRVRVRYKKNWLKISQLTDPIHIRSREAIIQALGAIATMRLGANNSQDASTFMPTAPITIAQQQLQLAAKMVDDEWRARFPNSTITLQWSTRTFGPAFPQIS
jgi:hypothetical protein